MSGAILDTHAHVKKLKAVGFTEEQAEVQAETMADLVNDRLVTKADSDLRIAELKTDFIKPRLSISPKSVRPEPVEGPFMVRQAHHERGFAHDFA